MKYRFARPLWAALCLAACATGVAAADLIPTADFARRLPLTMPRLSPDGKHFSVVYHDADGKTHAIAIYSVDDPSKPAALIRMPPYELPANIVWASSTRLVVARGKQDGSIGNTSYTGEIMAIDVDGKNPDYLYGYEAVGKRSATRQTDSGWGEIEGAPVQSNGHFYMRATSWSDKDRSTLYDVDATTSARKQMADIGIGDMAFMISPEGVAKFSYGTDADFKYVVFHREGSGWTKVPESGELQRFVPVASVAGSNRMYARYSPNGMGGEFVEQDEDGGNRRVISKDDFSLVTSGGLWTPVPLRPFGTYAESGIPKVTYVDPQEPIAKLHRALSLKFPGSFVSFIDFSEDGSQLMFGLSSDRDPGRYMLIDTKTYKVRSLFDVAPWIDPAKMSERRPMRFKASDGLELEAILTFPKGKSEANLPMVLLPHGGPIGIKDDWFYDEDAQFLANRGYLVLQVNFRGSGGRGNGFEQASYLKWGTRVQEDLIDGVKWAVDLRIADPVVVPIKSARAAG